MVLVNLAEILERMWIYFRNWRKLMWGFFKIVILKILKNSSICLNRLDIDRSMYKFWWRIAIYWPMRRRLLKQLERKVELLLRKDWNQYKWGRLLVWTSILVSKKYHQERIQEDQRKKYKSRMLKINKVPCII